jgi:hypothetical protein
MVFDTDRAPVWVPPCVREASRLRGAVKSLGNLDEETTQKIVAIIAAARNEILVITR